MPGLSLAPLATTDAEEYWRVYVAGRSDLPTPSVQAHLERYLALPPEEQATHYGIRQDGRLVGTIRLLPGTITGFSLDPDHAKLGMPALVRAVDLLRSGGAETITASYDERYAPDFEALGFRRTFARLRMEAFTRRLPASNVGLKHPEEAEVVHLAGFFRDVYEGHMEQALGMHVGSDEDWRGYIAGILRGESGRFMPDVSFVALDGGRIAAAILVSQWMGGPLVAELGVAADHRRRGLAFALLSAASTRLASLGEPKCALYVTEGNGPAVALYERFGFLQAGTRTATARLGPPVT